jgi:predicted methyltransferase
MWFGASACGAAPAARPEAPVSSPPAAAPLTARQSRVAPGTSECQAKIDAEARADLARWTPELHAEARALVEQPSRSSRETILSVLAGPHRRPGSADRDNARHPADTLEFFGFQPTMTVLEVAPAEGWYTEILAPALAKSGKLVITANEPGETAGDWFVCAGKRIRSLLARAPELYGKVQVVTVNQGSSPALGLDGKVDLVLLKLKLHRLLSQGSLVPWLRALHGSLKTNAVLAVEEPRAAPNATLEESRRNGYLPEQWVIQQVEAAGFKLVAKSELNANPTDTRDSPSEQLRASKDGVAPGESDRMTLKFLRIDAARTMLP